MLASYHCTTGNLTNLVFGIQKPGYRFFGNVFKRVTELIQQGYENFSTELGWCFVQKLHNLLGHHQRRTLAINSLIGEIQYLSKKMADVMVGR
jgi:hypothetical protein